MLSLIKIYADLVMQVLTIIFSFIRRYTNPSYSVGLYLNMNRIIKAEIDLNESIKAIKLLIRLVSFAKFQNTAFTVVCAQFWVRKARTNISYKQKREEMVKLGGGH